MAHRTCAYHRQVAVLLFLISNGGFLSGANGANVPPGLGQKFFGLDNQVIGEPWQQPEYGQDDRYSQWSEDESCPCYEPNLWRGDGPSFDPPPFYPDRSGRSDQQNQLKRLLNGLPPQRRPSVESIRQYLEQPPNLYSPFVKPLLIPQSEYPAVFNYQDYVSRFDRSPLSDDATGRNSLKTRFWPFSTSKPNPLSDNNGGQFYAGDNDFTPDYDSQDNWVNNLIRDPEYQNALILLARGSVPEAQTRFGKYRPSRPWRPHRPHRPQRPYRP